ncbi:MAG: hypothetical protein Q9220_007077 [cf. Caloplaca sp. 1 TL-2023]
MEFLSSFIPLDLPWLEISISIFAIVLVQTLLSSVVFRRDDEAPIEYFVALPEQCKPGWSGKLLEEPCVKISGSSAIQCYNPANGQLLGLVNPATPDGIDRAVVRAAEAQKEWAKTTFKQRRQVLRTMLR